jgi:hypothetical protein
VDTQSEENLVEVEEDVLADDLEVIWKMTI